MLRKYFIVICLVLFASSVIAQDNGDIRPRCIPNDKCEYFEDEETCYEDCNVEALTKQREKERNKILDLIRKSDVNSLAPTTQKPSNILVLILSIALIILFFVLLITLYYWIHGSKKLKKKIESEISGSAVQVRTVPGGKPIKKPIYAVGLPRRPERRF